MNKVVARYTDGKVVKGRTADFSPAKESFHLSVAEAPPGTPPILIRRDDLKALFFVKDFAGNPDHSEGNAFDPQRPAIGRRLRVTFADGEILVGTTSGYQPGRVGFFMEPADQTSNIERCFVIVASTSCIDLL